jgi:hypothetical protein
MKFNVSAELTDTEIRELVDHVAQRGLIEGLKYLGGEMDKFVSPDLIARLYETIGPLAEQIRRPNARRSVMNVPPWARSDAPPAWSPETTARATGARVAPIGGSSPVVTSCFPIEETKHLEAGWGCCRCATYNGLQRGLCRTCGHPRCTANGSRDVGPPPSIVTPPPSPDQGA